MIRRLPIALVASVGVACGGAQSAEPDLRTRQHVDLADEVGFVDPVEATGLVPDRRTWVLDTAGDTRWLSKGLLRERLLGADVVLIGERHDRAAHHEVQAALIRLGSTTERHPIVGMEMFMRTSQPALDAWSLGESDDATMLERTEWARVWRMDWALYAPIAEATRELGGHLAGLNLDPVLVRRASREGLAALETEDEDTRELLAPILAAMRPADPDHRAWLAESFAHHPPVEGETEAEREARLERFVEAQVLRDTAMAWHLDEARRSDPWGRVWGILGAGHVVEGWGVPSRLEAERVVTIVLRSTPSVDAVVAEAADVGASHADLVIWVEDADAPR